MNIPIFPLSICLLPQGFNQLRIFEPRYKRLVSESLKSGQGFGLCMLAEDKQNVMPIGTLTKIIDFDMLEDGMFAIAIEGVQRFKINHIEIESDGLKRAQVDLLDSWPKKPLNEAKDEEQLLKNTLKELLSQYPQHLAYYDESQFDDISWVCQRWLEIIPMDSKEKYHCINQHNHRLAKSFLCDIIKM